MRRAFARTQLVRALGAYSDGIGGIAADASGNAYVSGNASYNFPVTAGAYNTTPCPPNVFCLNRGFLAKINPAGSALVWATFVGNTVRPGLSAASSISPPRLDAQGNVFVSGSTGNNTQYPLVNPLQPANGFGGVYVTTFDPTGTTVYFSTVIYAPSNGGLSPGGVDIDTQGNVYVAGISSATDLPVTAGVFQTANAGGNDGFIAKINAPVASLPMTTLVANAEGDAPTIAPNTWIEIKGSNLAPTGNSRTWQTPDFVGNQMPTQLDHVSATVNGKNAYVYYISPTQLNVLTPPDPMSGPVQVVVSNNGIVASFNAQTQALSPSFFVFNGGPYIVAEHLSGTLVGPATLYPGASTPAMPGEEVVIFANGFGPTNVPVTGGSLTQSGTLSPLPVIQIGGATASVIYAALISPGLFQINAYVPATLANADQTITAIYNGQSTQSGTLITIHN